MIKGDGRRHANKLIGTHTTLMASVETIVSERAAALPDLTAGDWRRCAAVANDPPSISDCGTGVDRACQPRLSR